MPVEFQRYLTGEQVCTYLGIGQRHLKALRARKELPFVKVGRLCRYDKADVDRYARARKVAS